ncbi:MAG: STAS domain-containing protein [Candidatus Competibacteraceae bacterium]
MSNLIRNGKTTLIVDFTQLEYISSSGLRVLLMAAKQVRAAQGKWFWLRCRIRFAKYSISVVSPQSSKSIRRRKKPCKRSDKNRQHAIRPNRQPAAGAECEAIPFILATIIQLVDESTTT